MKATVGNLPYHSCKGRERREGGRIGRYKILKQSFSLSLAHRHDGKVKHVVIETRPDPVTGVLYYITPHGPCFDSLTSLIEEAKRNCIIKNQIFDVILTRSPPKVTQSLLSPLLLILLSLA